MKILVIQKHVVSNHDGFEKEYEVKIVRKIDERAKVKWLII